MHTRTSVALGVLVGATAPAAAQSASATAETMFRDARALLNAGKIAEACAAFESSEKAGPAITTLFSVGNCREKNGQLATAWGVFVDVQRHARSGSDPSDQQLGELAATKAAALEPRLSKLTITVVGDHAISGLEVRRGDDAIDPAAWNHPLPTDGGTYKITARAPGHADWTTTITVKPEGDAQTVEVPVLVVSAATSTPGSSAPPSKTLPLALGIGAVVLGGAAVGFELWGEHYNNEAQVNKNPTTALDEWHSANWRRYTAEGAGMVAIAGAGTAVYLYLRHGKESQTQAARGIELVPVVSPQLAGLELDGRW